MVMQACNLNLPKPYPSSSSSQISSLLFDPFSRSLALMLSDSSLLLYTSFSLFPPSSLSSPTLVPPVSTSSTFLRIHTSPTSAPRSLFLVAGPQRSSVLLRAWILSDDKKFTRARLDFRGDLNSTAVVLGLRHGFAVMLAGGVNAFVVHAPAERRVWVMGVRLVGGDAVELIKCASIACSAPIYAMRVSMGVLVLGEEKGVRVFPIRPLVKGRAARRRDVAERKVNAGLSSEMSKIRKKKSQNGVILTMDGGYSEHAVYREDGMNCCNAEEGGAGETSCRSCIGNEEVDHVLTKRKTLKLRQDSGEMGSFFMAFKHPEGQNPSCSTAVFTSLKAVSIHSLSQQRFLILDSDGGIHVLSLQNSSCGPQTNGLSSVPSNDGQIRHLDYTMKVQMLAVIPDISIRTQTVWISDGSHSVHVASVADSDFPASENGKDKCEEKLMQISATQAIFASQKIQDVVPLAMNAVLVLGQGSIFGSNVASEYLGVLKDEYLPLESSNVYRLQARHCRCFASSLEQDPVLDFGGLFCLGAFCFFLHYALKKCWR